MINFLKDFNPGGKKVFVRADFNVPIADNKISDDLRIREALPSIRYLLDNGAKQIVLASHLGKPKGVGFEKDFSLRVVADKLGELLLEKVFFADDCINTVIPEDERIVVLENLRFYKEEEANDSVFAKKLADHAEFYVDDAFGTAHRAHASVHAITQFLPSYCGFLLEKEIRMLDLSDAKRPIIAILGFAKLSDKIKVMDSLLNKVDQVLLGGAVTFTFLKASGLEVGKSLVDDKSLDLAKGMLKNPKMVLPVDIVVSKDKTSESMVVSAYNMPKDMIGFDIGPATVEEYKGVLKNAKTIIWNGPVGMFEIDRYAEATKMLCEYITALPDCRTIVGGGDTAAAVQKLGFYDKFSHVSTGGGASLEFLEGRKLPAIEALENNNM